MMRKYKDSNDDNIMHNNHKKVKAMKILVGKEWKKIVGKKKEQQQ
jgi:hypothetical protein